MKKLVVLAFASFLILAFGAAGYAQDVKLDFRASGFIDAQSHYSKNVPPLNAGAAAIYDSLPADYKTFVNGVPTRALDKKVSYWDSRMHLKFDLVMGKELSGTLMFEIDATRWGNAPGGIRPGSEAHAIGKWNTDQTGIEVKYMYFDFALPYFGIPAPISIRAGVQPLAIRPFFFVATDGAGLTGQIKAGDFGINPLYFKPAEGLDWAADDTDVWGLQLTAKVSTFTLGGYGLYYNMSAYPVPGQGFVAAPPVPFNSGLAASSQKADMFWLGLYADGKAGPVNLNFDIAYDYGKVRAFNASSVKYRGWAGRLKVDYPWERFNIGVTGMYASGSDANDTSSTGLPGTGAADGTPSSKVTSWVVPPGSEMSAVNAESAVFYGMEAGASGGQGWAVDMNGSQAHKGAFGGTWFAKLYGSYKVNPWYKVTLQGLYIGDTTKNGNTYGTARDAAGFRRNDSTIGYEFDLMNEFQIWKNLTFKVFGGYMFAKDATDLFNGITNHSVDNPWAIRTRLMYSF